MQLLLSYFHVFIPLLAADLFMYLRRLTFSQDVVLLSANLKIIIVLNKESLESLQHTQF